MSSLVRPLLCTGVISDCPLVFGPTALASVFDSPYISGGYYSQGLLDAETPDGTAAGSFAPGVSHVTLEINTGTTKMAASKHRGLENGKVNFLLMILAVLSCYVLPVEVSAINIKTGDMWVTDNAGAVDNGRILKITPAGVSTVAVTAADIDAARTVAGDTFPEGMGARFTDNDIVFDAFGNFYFTESVSDGLFRLNQNNQLVQLVKESDISAKTQETSASPQCIAPSSGTQLYVTDNKSDSILSINRITGEVEILVSELELESALGVEDIDLDGGIALSPDETTLYVVNDEDPDLLIAIDISGSTPAISQLAVETEFPGGDADLDHFITTAANGDILVVDDYNDRIARVSSEDGTVTVFLSESTIETVLGTDVDPWAGIDFDLEGNFFMAQSEDPDAILKWLVDDLGAGTIHTNSGSIFASEPTILADIGDPMGQTNFLGGFTFVPVIVPDPTIPEPGTILLLGLGVCGAVARRRSRCT